MSAVDFDSLHSKIRLGSFDAIKKSEFFLGENHASSDVAVLHVSDIKSILLKKNYSNTLIELPSAV